MSVETAAQKLSAKIIGALLRDARLKSQKTIEDCAHAIDVESSDIEQYELGEKPISLPELEGLSYYFQISMDHFWERKIEPSGDGGKFQAQSGRLIQLRHRMIGAAIRQTRIENDITLEEFAKQLNLETTLLQSYELGLEPVPIPVLEWISSRLNRSVKEFQDQKGPVGIWNAQQRIIKDFADLPMELQSFISKPVNRPYLELAVRLSEMSVDRLRAVAEGLLEITY